MEGISNSVDIPEWDEELLWDFSSAIEPSFDDLRLMLMKEMF